VRLTNWLGKINTVIDVGITKIISVTVITT